MPAGAVGSGDRRVGELLARTRHVLGPRSAVPVAQLETARRVGIPAGRHGRLGGGCGLGRRLGGSRFRLRFAHLGGKIVDRGVGGVGRSVCGLLGGSSPTGGLVDSSGGLLDGGDSRSSGDERGVGSGLVDGRRLLDRGLDGRRLLDRGLDRVSSGVSAAGAPSVSRCR